MKKIYEIELECYRNMKIKKIVKNMYWEYKK